MATTARKGTVPLDRALSKLGLATRAEARRLVAEGRVRVNGRIRRDPAERVVPERVRIAIDGIPQRAPEPFTIALHKPRGVVTTRSDPEGRKTVYDLLTGLEAHVVPAGRLDAATSGLLILTNDTRFADWLTDPASRVAKVYVVTVRGRVSPEDLPRLTAGLVDADERLTADAVALRKASGRESHLVVTLSEGKNREVRRMMAALGHEVTRLRRVQVGGLPLGPLAPGAWRRLTPADLAAAFPAWRPRRAAPQDAGPGSTPER